MASRYDYPSLEQTTKRPGFEDELDDQEAFQDWLGMQEQTKQQSAAPAGASQPQATMPLKKAA